MATTDIQLDTAHRCEPSQKCFWCAELLEVGTNDRFDEDSTYGCCRFCQELE